MGPSIIVNILPSVQNLLGDDWKKKLILYTFNILTLFFVANYLFEKCYVHFLREEGNLRKCVLYTHLKVDNYEWPLK